MVIISRYMSERYLFLGNRLCLDFVNTLIVRDSRITDLWTEPGDLLEWFRDAKVLTRDEWSELSSQWATSGQGRVALEEARHLRGLMRKALDRTVTGKQIPADVISDLNALLRNPSGYRQIARIRGGYTQRVFLNMRDFRDLLVPIAESAAELFCFGDPHSIGRCENPKCILYFYDTSKNHSRRWCSMRFCGNRFKAAAYYSRKKRKHS